MKRMFARRTSEVTVAGGTDQVLFGVSLPSNTRVNDIRVQINVIDNTHLDLMDAAMYAVEGWILPVFDPDAAPAYDTLWDTLVPKDSDVETLDLDTGASDTTPFYEPGEVDLSRLLDVGLQPERIYHRHKLLTINNGAAYKFQDNQTPFNVKWIAGDRFRIRIGRALRVHQPSALVFALASPSMDDTTTVVQTALAEAEWGQVRYIGHVMERALLHTLGVVEVGAETPWEEATALLFKHLDPDVYEEDAGFFTSLSWRAYAEAMVDHSVEGEMAVTAISTGR